MEIEDEIESLFPITCRIQAETIRNSDIRDVEYCIGAKSLKQALESKGIQHNRLLWGNYYGYFYQKDHFKSYKVGTLENVCLTLLEEPRTVTFILLPQEEA